MSLKLWSHSSLVGRALATPAMQWTKTAAIHTTKAAQQAAPTDNATAASSSSWTPQSIRTGVIARKKGMTSMWDDKGVRMPITVLQVSHNNNKEQPRSLFIYPIRYIVGGCYCHGCSYSWKEWILGTPDRQHHQEGKERIQALNRAFQKVGCRFASKARWIPCHWRCHASLGYWTTSNSFCHRSIRWCHCSFVSGFVDGEGVMWYSSISCI